MEELAITPHPPEERASADSGFGTAVLLKGWKWRDDKNDKMQVLLTTEVKEEK